VSPELKLLTDKAGNAHIGRGKEALDKFGLEGALFLGKVSEEGKFQDSKVLLDSIFPHVVFVCGARGSGKSYTVGVILEELAKKNRNVGVIVIDPVGVFWSMKKGNSQEKEVRALKEWELNPEGIDNIKVLIPEGAADRAPKESFDGFFSLKTGELTVDDWCLTFGLERFDPAALALERAIAKAGKNHTIADLVKILEGDEDLVSKVKGFSKVTRRGLISRLESARNWGVLSDKATPIEELSQAGKAVVVDVSFLEEGVASLVVGIIARKVLEIRKSGARSEAVDKVTTAVPPTWLIIDEAHTLIPNDRKTAASGAIVEYVKQGRRPGCSIVLATQQPSAIDSQVLSQLDLLISHKLVFYDDIKSVFRRVPTSVDRKMEDVSFIRTLPLGEALVADREEGSSRAFVIKIRPRRTQHEGRSSLAVERKVPKDLTKKAEEGKKPVEGRKIFSIPAKIDIDKATREAKKTLSRILFFVTAEHFLQKQMVYYPIWQVQIRRPSPRESFLVYVDGFLGELLTPNGKSKGVMEVLDLTPAEREMLVLLNDPMPMEKIVGKLRLDERMAKKYLNHLIEERLVLSTKKGEQVIYSAKEKRNVPLVPPKVVLSSQSVPVEGTVLEPDITEANVEKILTGLYGASCQIVDASVSHYPYWLFRTSKKRRIAVDAVTGKVDADAERVMPP
jgi:DNA helicase HerA-like ATPase/DNA-binding CsgD family transcriptional regulator